MQDVQSRLASVEKCCRRQCLLTYWLLLAIGLVVFSGAVQAPPSTIRASRIEILDDEGRCRVVLGKTGEDGALTAYGVRINNAEEKRMLSMNQEGQIILGPGRGRIFISPTKHGGVVVVKSPENGSHAAMSVGEDLAELQIRDENGEMKHWLSSSK